LHQLELVTADSMFP